MPLAFFMTPCSEVSDRSLQVALDKHQNRMGMNYFVTFLEHEVNTQSLRVVLQSGYIFDEDLNVINKKRKWNCS